MSFGKKHLFLLKMQFYQVDQNQSTVKGTTLESVLNINYKDLARYSNYWEKRGCIISRNERGGYSEYALTSIGELVIQKIRRRRKAFKTIVFLIGIGLFAYFFI